jgi:hypothetical protein
LIRRLLLTVALLTAAAAAAPANDADCLVVCPTEFRGALQGWLDHRRGEGLRVAVVDSGPTPEAVRAELERGGLGATTRFIVLVGDCRLSESAEADPRRDVPTQYRRPGPSANFGTTETLAGDAPYGDLDGDGVPEVAVGRLPVDTPAELRDWVEKIRAYESSLDFGPWRDRVQITAGVGGFGFLADKAIESATRSILTSTLPAAVRLAVTYASPTSPFYPGALDFFPATLRRYREGGMFWVYMGHGRVTELDRVPGPGGSRRPVLSEADLPLLERPAESAPIAVLLACYTGAFDARVDCLAERMVKAPGGPIAVLAGSRVTMPYGNAIAAQGLIHAVYQQRCPRLGSAWLAAQRELATEPQRGTPLARRRQLVDLLARALSPDAEALPEERIEHIHLYNLLGDPTLKLRHPSSFPLQVPSGVAQGEPIAIRGTAPHAGRLTVSLCHLPGSVPIDQRLSQSERYEQANCLDITQAEIPAHDGGAFVLEVTPPAELLGRVRVMVRVEGEAGWARAAAPLLIRPAAE